MFQSIKRGVAVILLGVASVAISATSAMLKLRDEEKSAADRVLEGRGLKAEDVYCSPLDYRLTEEAKVIASQDRVEDTKLHVVAKDGSLLEVFEGARKAS